MFIHVGVRKAGWNGGEAAIVQLQFSSERRTGPTPLVAFRRQSFIDWRPLMTAVHQHHILTTATSVRRQDILTVPHPTVYSQYLSHSWIKTTDLQDVIIICTLLHHLLNSQLVLIIYTQTHTHTHAQVNISNISWSDLHCFLARFPRQPPCQWYFLKRDLVVLLC